MQSFSQGDGAGEESVAQSFSDMFHFHFISSVLGPAFFPHAILQHSLL